MPKPTYYNERHPRRSYTYQETVSKIQAGDNPNVFRISLAMIGSIKVRGWNQKLRFGDENTDFLEWTKRTNPKTAITVVISKDIVGDYFIVFKGQIRNIFPNNIHIFFRIKRKSR